MPAGSSAVIVPVLSVMQVLSKPLPVMRNCRPDTTPSSLSLMILTVPCAVRTRNEYVLGSYIWPQSISCPSPLVASSTARGLIFHSSGRFLRRVTVFVLIGFVVVKRMVFPLILADRPEGSEEVMELFASIPLLSVKLPL